MIVLTGAAGFISSCLLTKLNAEGLFDIVLVDDFSRTDRTRNYVNKRYKELIPRATFLEWFEDNANRVSFVYHLGARTDTTEFNRELLNELNLHYS
jgi:ADP-L-glycero-D-manno-heptose 6-epimerase